MAMLAVAMSAGCAATSTQAPGAATGTVRGQVVAAPACPVEQRATPCPARPVAGARIEVRNGSTLVTSAAASSSGSFELQLPAGSYVVKATNPGGYPSTVDQKVVVVAGSTQEITLVVDSGIR